MSVLGIVDFQTLIEAKQMKQLQRSLVDSWPQVIVRMIRQHSSESRVGLYKDERRKKSFEVAARLNTSGWKCTLTPKIDASLRMVLSQRATCTQSQLCQEVQRAHDVRISQSTMSRRLRRMSITRKRTSCLIAEAELPRVKIVRARFLQRMTSATGI